MSTQKKSLGFFNWNGFSNSFGGDSAVGARIGKALKEIGYPICFASVINHSDNELEINSITLPDKKEIETTRNVQTLIDFFRLHSVEIIVSHIAIKKEVNRLLRRVADEIGASLVLEIHIDPEFYKRLKKYSVPKFLRPLEIQIGKFITRSRWRQAHKLADCIVVLSPEYISSFYKVSGLQNDGKVIAIANPNSFDSIPDNVLSKKSNVVLYVGRFAPQKRAERVPIIWSKIQDYHTDWELEMLAGGNDEDVDMLRKEMGKIGVKRFHYLGRQNPKPYLEKAKILVLTSDYEGVPLVILEAMQFGVIPIAFDSFSPYNRLIQNGEAGLSVTPYNLDEFAQKLSGLMKDEKRIIKMSENALSLSQRFNMEHIIERWEELFSSLTHRK